MKIYLVGGPVRDELLGLTPSDHDYVVVGATPELMLNHGFISVGKSFPVFLHPDTKEEYALARQEKKSGKGHQGFEFHFPPDITLEQDLWRRDFTINAMAKDLESGEIIDPYGGRQDLKARVLRHVSDHFSEDPLRIFRGLRFAAALKLKIDPQTWKLMKSMVQSQEWHHLSWERIIIEMEKGFMLKNASAYFSYMHELKIWSKRKPKWHKWFKPNILHQLWQKEIKKNQSDYKREIIWASFLSMVDEKEALPLPTLVYELQAFLRDLKRRTFKRPDDYLEMCNQLRWGQRSDFLVAFQFVLKLIQSPSKLTRLSTRLHKICSSYMKKTAAFKRTNKMLNKEVADALKLKTVKSTLAR
jgi:tRNA nucleotidyltransferase/poly(A) polymerase